MTHTVIQILGRGDIAELARADRTDGQLLDLFVRHRDHEAFGLVVRRHGPMVLGVCRRVLRNHADADDAFQAAFLVLARKAARIGTRDLLAQWLYGVAYNTARKLRESNTRRALRERPLAEIPEPPAAGGSDCRAELAALLDEELSRLPQHYRTAIVLCDLEGTTRKEAARLLGWPEGTVAGRLARARAMLAERLAGRGVAVPGGILFAVLAERHATACVPELLRAAATGEVAPRIAETTERVVHAMFVKKLKTLGLAALVCGLALAGAIGALSLPAAAQPAPPFDPIAKPAPPEKPAAKAEPRVAVAIPLAKLDAKETAETLAKVFPKTLTVVAARGENTLVVYDTEAEITKVRRVLEQLGEKDAPKKTTVIRLKTLDAGDAAKALSDIFNGPGGAKRVTIAPLAKENALVVEASELDTLTLLQLLRDHLDKDPAPEPKKYTLNFRTTQWADVLDWYAKESGLTDASTSRPKGNLTITPPKDKQFTLAEVTDLLNEALVQQKFILIRREKTFVVHPADERIDPTLVPRIELNELPNRGKMELVQVLLPLKELVAKDAAPEVQKMLTPFGSVTALEKTNALVITDMAGNINRIHQTLQQCAQEPGDALTHKFKFKKAQEIADALNTLLADLRGPKTFKVAVEATTNSVIVTGPPDKIVLAKKIIEEIDKPAKPGDPPFTPPEPELRKYPVPAGTAEAIAKTLQADMPGIKVIALPASNEIIVLATPTEHDEIAAKFKKINMAPGVALETVAIPLVLCDPAEMAAKLAKFFPSPAAGGPRIEARGGDKPAIVVTGTPEQIKEVRLVIEAIEGPTKKPEAPMPAPNAPKPKKITFQMKDASWDAVLDWFSTESGLTPIYSVKPTGKFTHIPPTPDTRYTIGEIVDILNEGMASQKFMLIRRQVSFTILPTDEQSDFRPIPRNELSDLPNRGKTEVVQVLIPLKTLAVEEVAPEVQKMLTPFGAVSVLKKMNTLVVVDTAGNVKRIADTIAKADEESGWNGTTYKCKYVKAADMAERLKQLLADKDTGTIEGSDPRPKDPRNSGEVGAGRVKSVAITVDEKTNSLTITAPPDKIALVRKIIEENDKPAKPGDPPFTPPEPELRKYPVPAGTAEALAKVLQADMPGIKVIALPTTNELIILASRDEHFELLSKLNWPRGRGTANGTVVIPLDASDPDEMAAKLAKLFPSPAAGGPRIEPLGGEKSVIVVQGTPEQIREVRIVIETIEGTTKKPEAPPPSAAPKKMSLQMKEQPWEKVLEWYSDAVGLKPLYTVKLTGTFSHTPPTAETRYTVAEITDILNDALAKQKLLLVRRQVSFVVFSTDDQPQQNWSLAPRIEQSELPNRGRTEMVSVHFYFKALAAENILPDVKKLVSPLGAATMLRNNTVIVVDRVENIRRIAQFIADAEATEAKK